MYHSKNIEEIKQELKTNENGLETKEVVKRQQANGKNVIPTPPKETIINIIIRQLWSPIVAILLIAAIFAIATKSYSDAIFILAVIGINTIIGTYQEWSSEKSAEKLQNMIKIKVKVLRDGNKKEIPSEDIVVGDIVILESGDKVPADIRLIETNNLSIDESILTGESIPKNKNSEENNQDVKVADRTNIAYAGSVVTNGRGKGIVVAIGEETEFGQVADKVLTSETAKSPLVIRMEKFTKQISIGFIILASILSIMLYLKGYHIGEIFENVVALTVSAIPEGLTIAMTIVLSIASAKMAKKNVIVKKLNAVESLGSCSVIATDKTGTLTANEQTAKKILLPSGDSAYIRGVGYNDIGEIKYDENLSDLTKQEFKEIAKLGMLNNEATLKFENGKWVHHGDAIDMAFLALAYKMDVKKEEEIIDIIPYESKLKYSAVSYKTKNEQYEIAIKGAPEKVLEFCGFVQVNGKIQHIDKEKIINQSEELSKEGYRVIAIAKKGNLGTVPKFPFVDLGSVPDFTFKGLVAFIDPVRQDVPDAIEMCHKAGIDVIMITGDHILTANAIGKKLGINNENIYARVTPMQKLDIVKKLQDKGEFVAVTGDGVNDSPALKAANIGVAMGSGTDIAKETGSMIITDDNFSTIVKGVEEGRRAYNNIRKVIYLLLSTGFSEIVLFVLSIIFNLPIPLIAIQLLWLNLITNGIQGDALAFEQDIEDVMSKKVRSNKESVFNKLLIKEILISTFVMAIIEFIFYVYLIKVRNLDITLARTYMLTLMVFMENIHIFNCRSETISCFKIPGLNNRFLIASIIITCLIQLFIIRIPVVASFFGLTTISVESAGFLLLLTFPIIFVMELFKRSLKKI